MLAKLVRPFTEASTYGALAGALTALQLTNHVPPGMIEPMWYAMAACTLAAVILKT